MRVLILTQGQHSVVSDHVFAWASKFKWFAQKAPRGNYYAVRHGPTIAGKRSAILLHREILKAPPGVLVDHEDGDGLNNLDENLRLCNRRQNMMNVTKRDYQRAVSSVYKGVWWDKQHRKWRVSIRVSYKQIHIGLFDDEHDAAKAYDCAALKYFGEFARTNFPRENYEKP